MRKNIIISGIALTSAVLLGACSSNDSTPGTDHSSPAPAPSPSALAAADHNTEDATFAQQMVPHHSQALDMAKLVPSRSTNPKVIDLASRIERAQGPEIRQMQSWLTAWGADMPGMPGMNGSMPGMMSGTDLTKLEGAEGTEFDKMWLDMMIRHHQGAVDMAKAELSTGSNVDAKALAQKIIDAQEAEITEMQELLTQS
ncbi:DUF305 domain-containing protein [Amycolatopsis mongoliensis]|uniref:DUF305 domain-containing protein n=1 Tax=Amycolatopsis mongoliensis TaxID=715475 RepID=A0A9Y2JID6_9PSEU|nr:DUF305 domain-containing protein [Amycolatopsis sp. 4-36]WIX98040.1 DUF305 domain-containing protein [Amycolatopsis sp. 4-36]